VTWPPLAPLRALPTGALVAAALALAVVEHGSIAALDWLPYALLAALVIVTVLASGAAVRPARAALVALGGMVALAAWAAISIAWSPVPPLARDEALLLLFYAFAFAIPLVSLRESEDRMVALGLVVLGLAALAVGTAVAALVADDPAAHFGDHRLSWPISYANAQAAFSAIAFWPAIALAARRQTPVGRRALALAAAVALVAATVMSQSKGSVIGLVLSGVVLLALCPARLRLLAPTVAAGIAAYVGYSPLTAPYREQNSIGSIRHAGAALLALTAVAGVVGVVYASVDRRLEPLVHARRLLRRAAVVAVAIGVAAGAAGFFLSVDAGDFFRTKWAELKSPKHDVGNLSSHLGSFGSNRYDFWRVAVDEFERHPIGGLGARGFGTVYLQHRRSGETPQRSHSLFFDTLSEEGTVGIVLLAVALGAPLVLIGRRLARIPAAAAFGGAVYFLAHGAVDWIATFPAIGVTFFCLLGIGCADGRRGWMRSRPRFAAIGAVAAVAIVLFLPTWIAARLVSPWVLKTRFLLVQPSELPAARADARHAHRLDPLSPDPLLVESRLAPSLGESIRLLERAARIEPRSYAIQVELAQRRFEVGDRAGAREALAAAAHLFPGSEIVSALRRSIGR
jgi:hypothetical protein